MASEKARDTEVPASRDPVAKAFWMLAHLVDSGQKRWSVRALATTLGMPVSTVHRTLSALAGAGIIRQDPATASYEFGSELHRLARRVVSAFPVVEIANGHLHRLAEATGETALLALYDPGRARMMFVSQAEGTHPLRYSVPVNSWLPMHRGASGLAILSYLDDESREEALAVGQGVDEIDAQVLEQTMATIRERGYAVSHGERISGATGVAAPVFDAGGRVIGDVLITIPQMRFQPEHETRLAGLVIACAARITDALGGPADRGESSR
jgi:IclR family transcriptional regulator, acetate operon repressor